MFMIDESQNLQLARQKSRLKSWIVDFIQIHYYVKKRFRKCVSAYCRLTFDCSFVLLPVDDLLRRTDFCEAATPDNFAQSNADIRQLAVGIFTWPSTGHKFCTLVN